MTVRFMKGTSIAELEREMQQVPGFRPRKSGIIRSRQAGETAGIGSCRYVNVWRAEKEQGKMCIRDSPEGVPGRPGGWAVSQYDVHKFR